MKIELNKKIKMKMIAKDVTGAEIARKMGVDRSSINKTIKGKIKSLRLRKAIAEALSVRVEKLWPETKGKT
jgi:transcriptional regulator with XRE-family HTH domain